MGNKEVRLLRDVSPSLYAELHPTMNTIDTTSLAPGSSKKVWWQCSRNPFHYWKTTVANRASGKGCAMCKGLYVVHGINDISVSNPILYSELHPTLNTIDTTILSPGSNKKVWWQCSKNPSHYWQAAVSHRTIGGGCSMCRGFYVVHGINDLSVTHPDLYVELHSTRNIIDTNVLYSGSSKKVWWQCSKNALHYWETAVTTRTIGHGCGMCTGRIVVHGANDLSVSHPDLYNELYVEKNTSEGIDHKTLFGNTPTKVWWKCRKDDRHFWKASVNSRSGIAQTGCPLCSNQKIVHGINDLSVSHPKLYSELHLELNARDNIEIKNLAAGTGKKVWWQCDKDETHHWLGVLGGRTGSDKNGCPLCSGKLVIHGVNDLSVTFPEIYAELHSELNAKHGIKTDTLSKRSPKKVWWQCRQDERHAWEALVSNRTANRRDSCAMCASKYIVHGINDLSVLNPSLYAELHPTRNTIDTTILSPGSAKKPWWQCSKNSSHCWEATVSSRNHGNGCPLCVTYRNESEFRTLFTEVTNLEFEDGHVIGERELFKRNKIQIDMINHEYSVIIEYDGAWTHGANDLHKRNAQQGLAKDTDTTNALLNAGYKVVRIRETPLQFLDMQHKNLFQVVFKDRDDKLPVVMSAVEALQTMGVEIEIRRSEVNELQ